MLLSILAAPAAIAVLFVVMARTERTLDHRTRLHPTPTGLLAAGTVTSRPPATEVAALMEQVLPR